MLFSLYFASTRAYMLVTHILLSIIQMLYDYDITLHFCEVLVWNYYLRGEKVGFEVIVEVYFRVSLMSMAQQELGWADSFIFLKTLAEVLYSVKAK